jgi:pyridoxamine 5'-phosphate oxidase
VADLPPDRVLTADMLVADPMDQFAHWYAEAEEAGQPEPEAMSLATVSPEGAPSVRIVLLKRHDAQGFTFYTNRTSRKAGEMAANSAVALVWRWYALERQVRVTGRVSYATDADSDAYFASRPRGSQAGAWASHQSQVLHDRGELEQRIAEIEARYEGRDIPRPPFWGGYVVTPDTVEFWQGRRSRLHDRFRYTRDGDGWQVDRLAP